VLSVTVAVAVLSSRTYVTFIVSPGFFASMT